MKKIYSTPVITVIAIATETICLGSGENGSISNVNINSSGDRITNTSEFGVKTNTVEWESWE